MYWLGGGGDRRVDGWLEEEEMKAWPNQAQLVRRLERPAEDHERGR